MPPVSEAFIGGLLAGYGIAIPIGAIAILIVETGLRHGFRLAAAAGAGAATADGIYAAAAAAFGAALASALAPWEQLLRAAAVAVLVAIAARGLLNLRGDRPAAAPPVPVGQPPPTPGGTADAGAGPASRIGRAEGAGSARRTWAAFVALTLANPATIAYFAAIILGLTATGTGFAAKAAFVAGAALASLSWQTTLAAVGAILRRRLSPRLQRAVVVLGNAVILVFAAVIAIGLADG